MAIVIYRIFKRGLCFAHGWHATQRGARALTTVSQNNNPMGSLTGLRTDRASHTNSADKTGMISPLANPSGNSKASLAQNDGIQKIFDRVEKDPKFAREMVELYTFEPDRELVNLNNLPPLNDAKAWQKYREKENAFSLESAAVTEQRISIFDNMKSAGAKDADIFKAIMNFNTSLPIDYQLRTGLSRYDGYA